MINFVQLGSNGGYDHATDFVNYYTDLIEKMVFVEPLPQAKIQDSLVQCYGGMNNAFIEPSAIAHADGEVKLFFLPNTNLRLSSLLPNVHSDFMRGTESVMVPSLTFDSLFKKYKLDKVQVLFVDVEGIDEDLLINLDLEKYGIETLVWEDSHSRRINSKQHNELLDKLYSYGGVIQQRGANKIFTKFGTENYKITLR